MNNKYDLIASDEKVIMNMYTLLLFIDYCTWGGIGIADV